MVVKGPYESFMEEHARQRVDFERFKALDEYFLVLVKLEIEDVSWSNLVEGSSGGAEWVFGGRKYHAYGSQDMRDCVQRVKGRV